jgi:hypothetical protein
MANAIITTMIAQIGNRAMALVGAKSLVAGDADLYFEVKVNRAAVKGSGMYKIGCSYDASKDLYNVSLWRFTMPSARNNWTVGQDEVKPLKGIDAESLAQTVVSLAGW